MLDRALLQSLDTNSIAIYAFVLCMFVHLGTIHMYMHISVDIFVHAYMNKPTYILI